jgi:hypothetical protein
LGLPAPTASSGKDRTVVDDAADPAEGFVAGSVDGEDEATRDQEQSWLPGVGMGIPSPVPPLSMSAGRSARSSRVAGHGLVQVAEGLLDAGVEVVRTPGAVRAWSCWFGRWLGQPCPGLVGDRAGLVAWGHSKQSSRSGGGESAMATVLGRGQGGRSGRRRDLGEFAAPGLSSCTFCLVPGRVDLRVT